MEVINNRIQKIIDYLGISPYEFSKRMGDKRPDALYNLLKNNKTQPSSKTLNKIKDNFSEINYVWLLTGEGSMLNDNNDNNDKGLSSKSNNTPKISPADVVVKLPSCPPALL